MDVKLCMFQFVVKPILLVYFRDCSLECIFHDVKSNYLLQLPNHYAHVINSEMSCDLKHPRGSLKSVCVDCQMLLYCTHFYSIHIYFLKISERHASKSLIHQRLEITTAIVISLDLQSPKMALNFLNKQ